MVNLPPKLSATQLLWWGVGVALGGLLLNQGFVRALVTHGMLGEQVLPGDVTSIVLAILPMISMLGVALIAVSFAVRAFSEDPTSTDEDEMNNDSGSV